MENNLAMYPEKNEILMALVEKYGAIHKSPYSGSYYTNPNKGWGGDIDGGIRISDHWNFGRHYNDDIEEFTPHCMTDMDVRILRVHSHLAVGRYNKDRGLYEIIEVIWLIDTYCLVDPAFDMWMSQQARV